MKNSILFQIFFSIFSVINSQLVVYNPEVNIHNPNNQRNQKNSLNQIHNITSHILLQISEETHTEVYILSLNLQGSLVGPLVLAQPLDACSPLTATDPKNVSEAPFIIAMRGNCTFVTKTNHAQLVGAKMIILVDNVDELTQSVMMIDDGHAYQLNIPAVLIDKEDGIKIINYLQPVEGETKQQVQMNIKFESKQYSHVNYTFWIKPNDRVSAKLVRDFNSYHKTLGENVKFQPRYGIRVCEMCRRLNFTNAFNIIPNNCLGGGRYCLQNPDPSYASESSGRDMLYEVLRQICLFKSQPEKWWDYFTLVDITCVSNFVGLKECSQEVMKKIQINYETVQQCVDSSFKKDPSTGKVDPIQAENPLLQEEVDSYMRNGVHYWPSVSVDSVQFRGNLIAEDIFEDICSGFENPPEECKKVIDFNGPQIELDDGVDLTELVVMIIFFLTLFGIGMLCVYKRMVRNEIQKDMSSQVNSMVSQYIAFYETKEKNNNSRLEMMERE